VKRIQEYVPVVDKVSKIQDTPREIIHVTFKQEYINEKYVETMEIHTHIINKCDKLEQIDPSQVDSSLIQQSIDFFININY